LKKLTNLLGAAIAHHIHLTLVAQIHIYNL